MLMLIGQLTGPGLNRADAAMRPGPAPANLNMLLDRVQQHYQETKSFSAKFDETITRTGAAPLYRSGMIYYEKPGKLRWEFEGSQPETIVSDGKTIYDYDPALNQVVETPLAQASRSNAAAAFLLGVGNVKRDFQAEAVMAPGSSGLVHVALTPKQEGQRIEAGIDRKTYNIATLSIGDAMGNRTNLSFSNIELNRPLRASQFTFTPPDGADIVSSGGH
ncbi:MAG: outer membrane lipoprotein chaperone LolA [Deltaproteobacteria bacterium]|nr:outer membrane lipoprotein chaperone LolA [Deltaproteobacteria bacterium]